MPTENPVVPANTTLNEKVMQACIDVDFMLLGTKLTAEYFKKEKGYSVLLMPTDEEANRGVTVAEMMDDIKKLVGDGVNFDELTNALKNLGAVDVMSIEVELNMAYLYIDSDGTNKVTEYAFQLTINTENLIPDDFKLFDISRMGVSVWNTNREKIISQMNLIKPEDLLK